ncbi:MAG: hypothetical protein ACOX1Y_13670 [Zhaonellaceae bacterium]|jgi:formylmethanofuran--tetrahydromethanopterin N-formyltransferase|nr:hypothetical protein [Clostridia bacterium]
MILNGVTIQDTYAEAWKLEVVRLVLTAMSYEIALSGAQQFVGAAGSSELGSKISGGIERKALPTETPDGRPGVIVAVTMNPEKREQMLEELALRIHLATLVPTCTVFDFMLPDVPADKVSIHSKLVNNWKNYEKEEVVNGRKLCVVPTITGYFRYEQEISIATQGSDGHFVCYALNEPSAVFAVKAAKEAMEAVDGAIPMGLGLEQVYRERDYCIGLKDVIDNSKVPDGVGSILNLLYFGVDQERVAKGLAVAVKAACKVPGVIQIGAMNFGGTFGPYKYYLRDAIK